MGSHTDIEGVILAILWQKQTDNTLYEVRSAGKTRRLYTNGVLHSQYNPSQVVTGSVWDLLMLPALSVPKDSVKRVLVMGVGGGAVLQQLNTFVAPNIMVGIELSEEHVLVAKRYFSLTQPNTVLHRADAVSWLRAYQGPAFDLIVDDLYGDNNGEPVRAVPLTTAWVETVLSHLAEDGTLVVNTVSPAELNASCLVSGGVMDKHFASALRLSTPLCHNAVGAFSKRQITVRTLRKSIIDHPILERAERKGLLKYSARKLL